MDIHCSLNFNFDIFSSSYTLSEERTLEGPVVAYRADVRGAVSLTTFYFYFLAVDAHRQTDDSSSEQLDALKRFHKLR